MNIDLKIKDRQTGKTTKLLIDYINDDQNSLFINVNNATYNLTKGYIETLSGIYLYMKSNKHDNNIIINDKIVDYIKHKDITKIYLDEWYFIQLNHNKAFNDLIQYCKNNNIDIQGVSSI